ncbi:unnamed protein product [Acanthosepion pharaonis]|uniref:Transmembrane protein n=1 Tax=Acanthosepion pharaonis TaxID=158019 RepID=A0A812DBN3_ACAPH|nr:unnamed protein product [Sepia pharaonis]
MLPISLLKPIDISGTSTSPRSSVASDPATLILASCRLLLSHEKRDQRQNEKKKYLTRWRRFNCVQSRQSQNKINKMADLSAMNEQRKPKSDLPEVRRSVFCFFFLLLLLPSLFLLMSLSDQYSPKTRVLSGLTRSRLDKTNATFSSLSDGRANPGSNPGHRHQSNTFAPPPKPPASYSRG